MRKFYLVGLALLSVCAFSASMASSAFAGVWLVEGSEIPELTTLNTEVEGPIVLLFYENNLTLVLTEILCKEILDGTLTGKTDFEITLVLNLAKEEVALGVRALSCSVIWDDGEFEDCAEGTNNFSLWPLNLPWKMALLVLNSTTDWETSFPAAAGWEIECKTLSGLTLVTLCEGSQKVLLENSATNSILVSLVPFANDSELIACTIGGVNQGKIGEFLNDTETLNLWAIGLELERLTTGLS